MSNDAAEAGLMRAWADEPGSGVHWRVLADLLEDAADPRAELLRLHHYILAAPWGRAGIGRESRLLELLEAGVTPAVPRLTNSLGMQFVLIPPGTFHMGALDRETRPRSDTYRDERPRHRVTITRPFWLGIHSVTQGQYRAVMRRNPSQFPISDAHPVENVTWTQAAQFCRKLSARPEEKKAKRAYRLPTEAEWEYACRAGSHRAFHFRDRYTHEHACFQHPQPDGHPAHPPSTVPVGSYPPNAWGLYDMHGNVWDWCADWFDPELYTRRARTDPTGPESHFENVRVFRGGGWCSWPLITRAACRSADTPDFSDNYLGFRAALAWRPGMA
jgi:formylglycine-generating enzyme required for sulfatase activity